MLGSLWASLLYSQTLTFEGLWNGGGQGVYTDGNEHFCFLPIDGSTGTFFITSTYTDDTVGALNSCLYLVEDSVIGEQCAHFNFISFENLNNIMYKIIIAPETYHENSQYTLMATFNGEFGRCPDYTQSALLGINIEQFNFLLGLAGLFTALGFFGSISYVILTLGNF